MRTLNIPVVDADIYTLITFGLKVSGFQIILGAKKILSIVYVQLRLSVYIYIYTLHSTAKTFSVYSTIYILSTVATESSIHSMSIIQEAGPRCRAVYDDGAAI